MGLRQGLKAFKGRFYRPEERTDRLDTIHRAVEMVFRTVGKDFILLKNIDDSSLLKDRLAQQKTQQRSRMLQWVNLGLNWTEQAVSFGVEQFARTQAQRVFLSTWVDKPLQATSFAFDIGHSFRLVTTTKNWLSFSSLSMGASSVGTVLQTAPHLARKVSEYFRWKISPRLTATGKVLCWAGESLGKLSPITFVVGEGGSIVLQAYGPESVAQGVSDLKAKIVEITRVSGKTLAMVGAVFGIAFFAAPRYGQAHASCIIEEFEQLQATGQEAKAKQLLETSQKEGWLSELNKWPILHHLQPDTWSVHRGNLQLYGEYSDFSKELLPGLIPDDISKDTLSEAIKIAEKALKAYEGNSDYTGIRIDILTRMAYAYLKTKRLSLN